MSRIEQHLEQKIEKEI